MSVVNHPEHVPDRNWKEWTAANLPKSDCNWISDIDTVIRSKGGCVAIVEIKRKGARVPIWQRNTYGLIAAALKYAEGETLTEYLPFPLTITSFKGIYEILFENTWFDDGKVFLTIDGGAEKEVSEAELQSILSFDNCTICYPSTCSCHNPTSC